MRMKSSILYVGGEDHNLRIPFLLAMQRYGFKVIAAGSADPTPFVSAGIEYHKFRFNRFTSPVRDLESLGVLSEILETVRADIIHSFDLKPNLMSAFASRGRHIVVRTINGLGWLFSSQSPMAWGLRPVYCALQKRAASYTSATVFQNRDDHGFFARKHLLGNSKALVIPGSGIDVEGFERSQASQRAPDIIRRELGLEEGAKIVITVARLTRQKGIPTLLNAAEVVHRAEPRARFLLVGPRDTEGPFAIGQQEIERHAPYVVALGHRSDIPALLGVSDVCAFPTEYREGIPRALLEAGLAALPIVTTRMPGCSDVVVDGWNGYLVPTRSPSELANRILELLADPVKARSMGANSPRMIRETYTLQSVVDSYASLYRELLP